MTTGKHVGAASAICAAALLLAACGAQGSAASPKGTTKTTPASGAGAVLSVESGPSGPITRNFNPFSTASPLQVLGGEYLIYEPLLQFNLLKPGSVQPWLAKSYSWSSGGRSLTLHLRSGVTFSNGAPFTASDVAFTFNLLRKYAALNTDGLPITSATAPTPTTAVVNFSSPAYVLLYYIGSQPMLPAPQWSKVANPATYTNPDPVGTGPYVLSSFSPEGYQLKKRSGYWQPGRPRVAKISFPVYDSTSSVNLALEQGALSWAGNFVVNIKRAYVDKNPATNHYWFAPTSTVSLIPNVQKFPLNSLAVRQAVSDAISRQQVSLEGEDGEEAPAVGAGSLTGLILPTDKSYVTPATASYRTQTSIALAKSTLEKAGWKMGSNGYFVSPSGKTLAFTIVDPSAYSDYMTDDQIMASELKKAGIDATIAGLSVAAWTAAVADGNFQATTHWSNSGPTPYYLYDGWLSSSLSAPLGKPASGDYGRFQSAAASTYLNQFASTNSAATQKADIVGLEKITATQLPVIPLVYGSAWYEYSTAHFTGWPTPSSPYTVGQPGGPNQEVTVLHLKPVG